MIHYHGTPLSPRAVLLELAGRHFCVPFTRPDDLKVCDQIGQSLMLDNGAFTIWQGRGRRRALDWDAWREWAENWLDRPTTWCVIPDAIDAGEDHNDRLLDRYGDVTRGAPVWHLDESFDRLRRLAAAFERICFGSSGAYRDLGNDRWHRRVSLAFDVLADERGRVPWVHMLRGMAQSGGRYPFASVDSTDVARNHNRPQNTARRLADRWDQRNVPAVWKHAGVQLEVT